MSKVRSEVDWEIKQLCLAIEHYEKAIHETFILKDMKRYEEVIHNLNAKVKGLEHERDTT